MCSKRNAVLHVLLLCLLLSTAHAHPQDQSLLSYRYEAVVSKPAFDADTHYYQIVLGQVIQSDVEVRVYKSVTVRLLGIDTWEIRGDERPQGLIARDAVRTLLNQGFGKIHLHTDNEPDKYGRLLAEVWVSGINLTPYLIAKGHGKPYLGLTPWSEE
jgi:micrococcal nuclease